MKARTTYLQQLTDDFGIWQHASEKNVLSEHGYALDDVARGLIVYLVHKDTARAGICFEFISKAFSLGRVGLFTAERKAIPNSLSQDMIGLSLWALATGYQLLKDPEYLKLYQEMFRIWQKELLDRYYFRPAAYALIAASTLKDRESSDKFAHKLIKDFDPGIGWFAPKLTYANAVPLIALLSYLSQFQLRSARELLVLESSITVINKYTYIGKIPAPVGNREWQELGSKLRDVYGQQPIDAGFNLMFYSLAYEYFSEQKLKEAAHDWHQWFFGNNIWRVSLVDTDNGCADGLDENGLNTNKGAESTIMFLLGEYYYEAIIASKEQP